MKPQQQRHCHQTKGLMSRTVAVHVRYKSLYISLSSSAKQQREMITFCVFWRWFEERERRRLIFGMLILNSTLALHLRTEQVLRLIGARNS